MDIRKGTKYLIASPTSMGVRLVPTTRTTIQEADTFKLTTTSAESNVLNIASSLGYKTLALTKFVNGSPIADRIQRDLRSRNIDYTPVYVDQDGPWGNRHQFNIADSGFGLRGASVWNDRSGEVGRTISVEDFDLDEIFERDGIGILHISGLIAALSPETGRMCVELSKAAKALTSHRFLFTQKQALRRELASLHRGRNKDCHIFKRSHML